MIIMYEFEKYYCLLQKHFFFRITEKFAGLF